MKKLFSFLIVISMLLLASCSGNTAVKTAVRTAPANTREAAAASSAGPADAVDFEKLDIAGSAFNDVASGKSSEYGDKKFLKEFQSFIENQVYFPPTDTGWEDCFTVDLLDEGGKKLLGMTLGARSITFDRDVRIKGGLFNKGSTYELEQWISDYMGQFADGAVMNPAYLYFPSKIRLPDGAYKGELINGGSRTVNQFETLDRLQAFVDASLAGKEFEVTGGERLYSFAAMQGEEARQAKARVINVSCDSNNPKIYISSANKYPEFTDGNGFSLYRDDKTPGIYRLSVYGEVLDIRVGDAFDKAFQELFDNDLKEKLVLDAAGVEELFRQNKPGAMDYLCRNLGMDPWGARADDKLEKKTIKLGNGNKYTVLAVKNPFDLRLMLFNGKSGAYAGYLDFGGREAGTDYTVRRAGGHTWIVGRSCRGHGTGLNIYSQDWYLLGDQGAKPALSIPYEAYDFSPYAGHAAMADGIRLIQGDAIKVEADYSITRVYYVPDIDGADEDPEDEYGGVAFKFKQKAEFVWDDAFESFICPYPYFIQGMEVSPDAAELSKKCGGILEKNYDRLLSCIEALASVEDETDRTHKAGAYGQFLKDCPDSEKKAALLRLLGNLD